MSVVSALPMLFSAAFWLLSLSPSQPAADSPSRNYGRAARALLWLACRLARCLQTALLFASRQRPVNGDYARTDRPTGWRRKGWRRPSQTRSMTKPEHTRVPIRDMWVGTLAMRPLFE